MTTICPTFSVEIKTEIFLTKLADEIITRLNEFIPVNQHNPASSCTYPLICRIGRWWHF
jgi:hypothetical protein